MTPSVLVTNIGELVTNDPGLGDGSPLGLLSDAALVIDGALIAWVGKRDQAPAADSVLDVDGAAVIPGFVDSHSHLVFAGDRSEEFAARMAGRPYSAGGITSTVEATRQAPDEALAANVARLMSEMARQGTTTVEIKSGYGLTVADEARSLAIAAALTAETTFLGAHVVPAEYADDPASYVDLVTGPMLTAATPHAKWIDVFCERGAFDADQARAIDCIAAGLQPRVHANQLVRRHSWTDADVADLRDAAVVATLLPGVEFSTRSPCGPPARATDCNVLDRRRCGPAAPSVVTAATVVRMPTGVDVHCERTPRPRHAILTRGHGRGSPAAASPRQPARLAGTRRWRAKLARRPRTTALCLDRRRCGRPARRSRGGHLLPGVAGGAAVPDVRSARRR